MPWRKTNQQEQRYQLILAMRAGEESVAEVCERLGIARKTAYKWRGRYRAGRLGGLKDRSRRPETVPGRPTRRWLDRLRRGRRRHPSWGARKLHHDLGRDFGKVGLPSRAAIGRWLKRWGLACGRRRRRPGPVVVRRPVRKARACNDGPSTSRAGTARGTAPGWNR